jgi:hypothetical protein
MSAFATFFASAVPAAGVVDDGAMQLVPARCQKIGGAVPVPRGLIRAISVPLPVRRPPLWSFYYV